MIFSRQRSAKQTAALSGLGGLIVAAGFLLPSARHPSPPNPHYPIWLWMTLFSALLASGMTLSLLVGSDLKEGITNQRWSAEEVVSLQAALESGWWVFFGMACLTTSFVFMCMVPARMNVVWALLILGQTMGRLGFSARAARSTAPPSGFNGQTFSPLRSEHWGERS